MRENKGFITACCLLWTCVLAIGCFGETGIGFLLVLFLLPVTIISWAVLLIIAVGKFFLRGYLPWEKRLVPFYFLIVPIFVWFVTGTAAREIDKESTWLVIKMYNFTGSENFKFKKDGSYSQWRDSPLGSSSKATGRYERRDSILTLYPQVETRTGQAIRVAIRPYSEFKKAHASSSIFLALLDTTTQTR
jgi:hypothetical protein